MNHLFLTWRICFLLQLTVMSFLIGCGPKATAVEPKVNPQPGKQPALQKETNQTAAFDKTNPSKETSASLENDTSPKKEPRPAPSSGMNNTEDTSASQTEPIDAATVTNIESRILGLINSSEGKTAKVNQLGTVSTNSGAFIAFKVRVESDSSPEMPLLLVLAVPRNDTFGLLTFNLGATISVPGSLEETHLESFTSLKFHHEVVSAELTVTSRLTEYLTCDDCTGRAVYPKTRKKYQLMCLNNEFQEDVCSLTEIGLEITGPGFEVDNNGKKYPLEGEIDASEQYQLKFEIEKGHYRISHQSGTLAPNQQKGIGRFPFSKFPGGDMSDDLEEYIEFLEF